MSGGAPLSDLNIHRGLTHGYSKNPSSLLRALLNLLIHAALSGPNKIWASGVVNLHLNENLLPGAWTNAQGTIDSAFSFPLQQDYIWRREFLVPTVDIVRQHK